MNRFDLLVTGYSLLLMIGGVIGYLAAGSVTSLLMSAIFAILLIGALFLLRFYPDESAKLIYLLLAALTLFFSYRWYNGKFFPSGAFALLSLFVLLFSLYLQSKNKLKS